MSCCAKQKKDVIRATHTADDEEETLQLPELGGGNG